MAPVTWRDGVHITGTAIWCDARRRRDVCFASSADRVGAAGHGQLIATPTTIALAGASPDAGHLAAPPRRPFTLGTLRLELIASGRSAGAAALHVDARGRTVLYAAELRTRDPAPGEVAAEVRACDALVVAAPFGAPHHEFPPRADVIARVVAWVHAERAQQRVPALVVDTPLDGVEVAALLAAAGLAIAGSKAIRDVAAQLDAPLASAARADAIVRLEHARVRAAPAALVSGRALDPHPYAAGFAWPFAAGRTELLAWIAQTRARTIFVTGACAEPIAAALGPNARSLGPPRQMTLFEARPS